MTYAPDPMDDFPLFVYGTLMTGQRNHGLLQHLNARPGCPARVDGASLYQREGEPYPRLVYPARRLHTAPVFGEVWYVTAAALAALDRLEGAPQVPGMFRRRILPVTLYAGHGLEYKTDAQVYVSAVRPGKDALWTPIGVSWAWRAATGPRIHA